ncbi:hypothetical protein QYM36_010085 [Artemia franciscana]|uniref:Uncharacterized protein n=1 Tax=Artemia franciscana TaxID=6661 RepID=A0AA88L7D2_ARTSF|nr:hypothetical protein QYM36_010085 [Artemia franciscana]
MIIISMEVQYSSDVCPKYKLHISSDDDADDWLPDLSVSNVESLSNLLAGELSSSDDETDNQVDGVREANNEQETSNNKDYLPLGVIVKKWNKIFGIKRCRALYRVHVAYWDRSFT